MRKLIWFGDASAKLHMNLYGLVIASARVYVNLNGLVTPGPGYT